MYMHTAYYAIYMYVYIYIFCDMYNICIHKYIHTHMMHLCISILCQDDVAEDMKPLDTEEETLFKLYPGHWWACHVCIRPTNRRMTLKWVPTARTNRARIWVWMKIIERKKNGWVIRTHHQNTITFCGSSGTQFASHTPTDTNHLWKIERIYCLMFFTCHFFFLTGLYPLMNLQSLGSRTTQFGGHDQHWSFRDD